MNFIIHEAADEITTLRARGKELESGGWISVEDRLPDCDEFLGGNFRGSPWMAVCWKFKVHNQNGDYYKYTGGEVVTKNNITHWQPLPDPPKE